MAAAKFKLFIEQGATYSKRFTWKAGTPAVAVDLTGYTAKMQIRKEFVSPTPYVTLTTENGGIVLGGVLGGVAGAIELIISDEATAAFTWTTGVYDLEMTAPSGHVRRLLKGAVVVDPEVTRD